MLHELAPDIAELQADDAAPIGHPEPTTALTVLTGAGASLYAGAPSTDDLTELVAESELSALILRTLRVQSADPALVNFEDVLHALEELELLTDANAGSRPVRDIRPFVALSRLLRDARVDPTALKRERFGAIEKIGERLRAIRYGEWRPLYAWLRLFVDTYDIRWYTLNYDILADVVTYALSLRTGKGWFDGFGRAIDMDGSQGFRVDQYANPRNFDFGRFYLSLAHLHGSIGYGYHRSQEQLAHHLPFEIVQAQSLAAAADNWRRFHAVAIADDHIELGPVSPIISGLRKSDKLNVRPYGNYLNSFAQALSASPFLMIVGYRGDDPHINFWLREFIDIHTERGRVIEVTAADDPNSSVVSRLGAYDLRWQPVEAGAYLNRAGVRTLLITTGVTPGTVPPAELFLAHMAGALI